MPVRKRPADGADTWQRQLAALVPAASRIPSSGTSSLAGQAAWTGFLKAESQFEARDWHCRADVYSEHIAQVEQSIRAFAEQNSADITAAKGEWAAVEDRAAQLGYAGQTGRIP